MKPKCPPRIVRTIRVWGLLSISLKGRARGEDSVNLYHIALSMGDSQLWGTKGSSADVMHTKGLQILCSLSEFLQSL